MAQTDDLATESNASNDGAFGVAKLYCVGKRRGERFLQHRGVGQVCQTLLTEVRHLILIFRSTPVTRAFILFGGSQAHGHSLAVAARKQIPIREVLVTLNRDSPLAQRPARRDDFRL